MSVEFTKENINIYFKELGKIFRKLNGTKMRAEIILIGGGAILANYEFREMTTDIDAVIRSSSVMKEAITYVSDKYNLPWDWLNEGFKNTESFSEKIDEISVYYKTFSNVLEIRTVSAEYLIAMKLMSGRLYKNDLSDIAGILLEHEKRSTTISKESIEKALIKLYGQKSIPVTSALLLDEVFKSKDLEDTYYKYRESEVEAKDIIIKFDKENPGKLKGENITGIIEQVRKKMKDAESV